MYVGTQGYNLVYNIKLFYTQWTNFLSNQDNFSALWRGYIIKIFC